MMAKLSEIKEYLGLAGVTEHDDLLEALSLSVSAWIERYTGRKFEQATATEYFDGGTKELFLGSFPIISVTSVKQNVGTQNTPVWQTISAEEYVKYFPTGVILHTSVFPSGDQNIEVVYVAGYAVLPEDIKHLAKELIGRRFNQRKAQGIKAESIGSARIDWNTELTEEQKMILENYRKVRV